MKNARLIVFGGAVALCACVTEDPDEADTTSNGTPTPGSATSAGPSGPSPATTSVATTDTPGQTTGNGSTTDPTAAGQAQLGFYALAYDDLFGGKGAAQAPQGWVDQGAPVAGGVGTGGPGPGPGTGGPPGGAGSGGLEWELTGFTLTTTMIQVSVDGTTWETVYDDPAGTDLDIIGGAGSIPAALVPVGTYTHVFLLITDVTYSRGDSCVDQSVFDAPKPIGGVLTTQAIAEAEYGQDWTAMWAGDFKGALPATAPSEVHPMANDDFFWLLADEVTLAEGDTSLIITAAPDPAYTAPAICDDAPGKPIWAVGTAEGLGAL